MGILDAILGRTRPVKPNLDVLFAVPAAATTLQAALDLVPTGVGAVCFKGAEGRYAAQARADAVALLDADTAAGTEVTGDEYGYTWVTRRRPDADLAALVTDLHAVNTTLADSGFGQGLLCTVIGFVAAADPARRLGLVYLFKRGTFYPFAPTGGQARDNDLELQVRAQLSGELPVERDLTRWFPVWGAPTP
jgi:PspAB-like protein